MNSHAHMILELPAPKEVSMIVKPPPAQYWVELTENKCKWEKYVEETLTIARLATLIQEREIEDLKI